MKNHTEITDRLALSIRGLWDIESMEEKKKIIKHYDNLYRLFLLVKNKPELFMDTNARPRPVSGA